jgi:uncharacterized protein
LTSGPQAPAGETASPARRAVSDDLVFAGLAPLQAAERTPAKSHKRGGAYTKSMRVVVTGASGFLGRAIVAALMARNDEVVALSRSPKPRWRAFDPLGPPDPAPFESADGVIHLAGETITGRWTSEKKKKIYDSRVIGTRTVVASIAACKQRPRVLVSASGAGYYGDRGDTPLDESAPPGKDFLADVCVAWEREAAAAQQHGVRVAMLRQGLVLGPKGGALEAMLPPFRAGLGGPLGSGKQWWPWIHLDDDIALMLFALDCEISGPINAVSPDLATNARFSHALGHVLKRPTLLHVPPFALRLILGEFAESLLASQRALAAKALAAGFTFKHTHLEEALLQILTSGKRLQARDSA